MKKVAIGLVVLIALTLVVACGVGQSPGTTDTPKSTALPPSVSFFPVALDKYAGTPYPAALARGTLVLDAGLLKLRGNWGTDSHLIIWPAGFSLEEKNGQLQILYPGGDLAAVIGNSLDLGGGIVPREIVEKYIGGPLPGDASGPYWLTGSAKPSPTPYPSTPGSTPSTTPGAAQFELKRAIWNWNSIFFIGSTDLPEGSRLDTQLYRDGQPVDWWPPVAFGFVLDGRWEVSVKGLEWNLPAALSDFAPGYSFGVTDRSNPQIGATFDLPFPAYTPNPEAALVDTNWRLLALNENPLVPGTYITLNFLTFNGGSIQGNATINGYGFKYESDQPDKLLFYDGAQTLMGGMQNWMDQEAAYMRCLRKAAFFRLQDNHLEIYDDQHLRLLVFERIN